MSDDEQDLATCLQVGVQPPQRLPADRRQVQR
jgi:hypothetical protein